MPAIPLLRVEGDAYACGLAHGRRFAREIADNLETYLSRFAAASAGRMVTNPGGVLIKNAAGDVVGAVGISGDTSDRDEACAIAGIEAAGFKADPGQDAS